MALVPLYLKDHVSVITGGAQGIGLAVAGALGEAGSTVIISDVNERTGEAAAAQLNAAGFDYLFTGC